MTFDSDGHFDGRQCRVMLCMCVCNCVHVSVLYYRTENFRCCKPRFSLFVVAPIFIVKLPREKTIKVGSTLFFNCLVEKTKLPEYLIGVDIIAKGMSLVTANFSLL